MLSVKQKSYSYNQLSVLLHVPAKPGIYALHNSTRCIYVGESENLRESLYGHLQGDRPWITLWEPSMFFFELCAERSMVQRKDQLVAELQPAIKDFNGDQHLSPDSRAFPAASTIGSL